MNKFLKMFVGLACVASLAACSNDEPANGNNEDKPIGNVAYMAIQIKAADSRAGEATGDFKDGDASEHGVDNAQFFFFYADGTYALKAKIVNPTFGEDNPDDANIEYLATQNILVLEDLTDNKVPKYLFTVLNAPNFTPENTLAATTAKANNWKDTTNGNFFVMSTSAYFGSTNNHDDAYPNANVLVTGNFYTTEQAAKNEKNPVVIYVERLAAKVQVSVGATATQIDGKNYYALTQSVAGNDNNVNPGSATTSQLYLSVDGWQLNATAPQSYMGKQLPAEWNTTDAPFNNWNSADRFRSYWAKSVVYGQNPQDVLEYVNTPNFTAANNGLLAVSTAFADAADAPKAYCNENTNTVAQLFTNNGTGNIIPANATHVLVYATVGEKNAEGHFAPVDMINLNGILYKEDALLAHLLNVVNNTDAGKAALNVYFEDAANSTEAVTKYVQFSTSDLEFYQPTGATYEQCKVQINAAAKAKTAYVYNPDATEEADKYTEITTDWAATLQGFINQAQGSNNLVRYNGGKTVYIIPIEHETAAADKTLGKYGVVRNHWYNVNITKFSKVGHGIFTPEGGQEIKPDQPEDPTYCVDATIKILNWRLVSQNVGL